MIGKKKNKIKDLYNLEIPDELRLENEERRIQAATFDRVDLVIQFQPGRDKIGAVIQSFIDAIVQHDIIVKEIEKQLLVIDEIKKLYRKKVRLFRTLDNTWNLIYTNPTEFTEYLELIPKMDNIEKRLQLIEDIEIKTALQAQYNRYKLLEPKCSRQKIIYELYQEARKEKEKVTKEYVMAEKLLNQLQEKEILLASLISDDHMIADERGITLTELFPNIHVGYILTKINQYSVEFLPFEEVNKCIIRSKSPHKIEVKRYDYRYNVVEQKWYSLTELRQSGVFIENPILRKIAFIIAASKGDVKLLSQYIDEGEDPNATDTTGNTALLTSAVNKHIDAVELLQSKGAIIDCRDKNYMTPLLYVINRGLVDLVRLLIAFGADKNAIDKNGHGCFYYSILSKHLQLVKMFFKSNEKNMKEKLWGFTPLHLAASIGDLPIVEYLLQQKCSIYQLDNNKKTSEEIAKDCKYENIRKRLEEERITSCGQCIYYDVEKSFQLWIGDSTCMDIEWCLDIDFNCIIYLHQENKVPLPYHWLLEQEENKARIEKIRHPSTASTINGVLSKLPTQMTKKKRTNLVPRKSQDHRSGSMMNNLLLAGPAPPPSTSPQSMRKHRAALAMVSPLTNKPASPPSPTSLNEQQLVVRNPSEMVHDDDDLSDIDEPSASRRSTAMKQKGNNNNRKNKKKTTTFSTIKALPSYSRRRADSEDSLGNDDDEEDEEDDDDDFYQDDLLLDINENEIQFHPFHVPIHPDDGDNHDQIEYLYQYLPLIMDILPLYHLHLNEELLAKQSSYTTLTNNTSAEHSLADVTRVSLLGKSIFSQGSNNTARTKIIPIKKVLICDDSGNSLSPAIAIMYLLLKQSKRIKESLEEMKLCRPSIEIGSTIMKGLEDMQYKYDEKVLKRMNAKLRESVVTSIAF